VAELDAATLNARLLDGHRLLVTRDKSGNVASCVVEFFGEGVPVPLFNTYLSNGMIAVPKDGRGYSISATGKKKLLASPRSRR
jgi:hypothetical protein